jgi:hypothetical protein
LVRRNVVTTRHWQDDVVREILEVVDSLLDGVDSEALDAKVGVGVTFAIESVFEDNGGAVCFLGWRNVNVI